MNAIAEAAVGAVLMLALTAAVAQSDRKALVASGQQIAKSGANGVTACVTCHGANGEGMQGAGFPRLAAQSEYYLNRQLTLFANGERNNPVMTPIAKAMTRQQMAATSAYYATLANAAPGSNASAAAATGKPNASAAQQDRGRMLAEWGDESRQVQACANCHGPGGRGSVFTFPSLAGQHQDYLQGSMAGWKSGARNTDPSQQMPTIAKRLSDEDIAAVSAYYASQPAPPPVQENIPAGSKSRPVAPPSRRPSAATQPAQNPAQGTGTEQGAPTSGGNQGPGGGGGTKSTPRGQGEGH